MKNQSFYKNLEKPSCIGLFLTDRAKNFLGTLALETGIPVVAEMLQKLKFSSYVLYSSYIFHIYVTCFVIYLLYIYMSHQFFYIFLFSHYLILDLCDNVFIFIINYYDGKFLF